MPASTTRIVAPTGYPVTLGDVRGHARVVSTYDNPTIEASIIPAATEFAEAFQKRQLMPATWRLTLDRFPAWAIELPLPPLLSVTEVVYTDTAGASQVLTTTEYQSDVDAQPGRLAPAYGKYWPATRDDTLGAVRIKFTAGYGATDALARTNLPANTKLGILMLCAHWYQNREALVSGILAPDVAHSVEALLRGDVCEPAECDEELEYA